jgi:hypothetical protein
MFRKWNARGKSILLLIIALSLLAAAGGSVALFGDRFLWTRPARPNDIGGEDATTQRPHKRDDVENGDATTPQQEMPQQPAQEIPESVRLQLEQLKSCRPVDLLKLLDGWAAQHGPERKTHWHVVRVAAAESQDTKTRIAACYLADRLSAPPDIGKPAPYCDPEAVAPLLSCLNSGDPDLVSRAAGALGTMSMVHPSLGIKGKALPTLKKLIASKDPKIVEGAVGLAPMLAAFELAPDVVAAWQRHASVPRFEELCLEKLDMLLGLWVQHEVAKAHPEWLDKKASPKEKIKIAIRIATAARPKEKKLLKELGKSPAKWMEYWAKVLNSLSPLPATSKGVRCSRACLVMPESHLLLGVSEKPYFRKP